MTAMISAALSAHILIVEDEPAIRDLLHTALERHQHRVTEADSAELARIKLEDPTIDMVLVDWMLPGGSGLELVRNLRKNELYKKLPIIMVTARSDESHISQGLDAGADDYVSKPFSPRELLSRIQAVLRRTDNLPEDGVIKHGDITLDVRQHLLTVGDSAIDLGHTEFKLLTFLMKNPNRVYSRAEILDHVWGIGTFIEERTVDVHILRLRKSLKPAAHDDLIATVRGAGYRLRVRD